MVKNKGGRPSGPKEHNGGRWTEAAFHNFIRNNLRLASRKWGPFADCKKAAKVRYGVYKCNDCKEEIKPKVLINGKKYDNVLVDHIEPIVDPYKGFEGYDIYIPRMFCEIDNLQVLCKSCHDAKSKIENEIRKENG